MTTTYHIRNRTTGKFYKEYAYDFDQSTRSSSYSLKFAEKGWGKVFKDLGKVKLHLLYLVGIMEPGPELDRLREKRRKAGQNLTWEQMQVDQTYQRAAHEEELWEIMHPGYANVPEWMSNPRPISGIPEDWEVVEVVDKKTVTVVGLNPTGYAAEALKLKVLTDSHGSAVKDVYKKLDKNGKRSEFRYVAAVQINPDTIDWNQWTQDIKVDPAPVDETIESMGLKRSAMVRTTKQDSIAIAVKDQETAVWFQFTYAGKDRVVAIDMETLEEVVSNSRS